MKTSLDHLEKGLVSIIIPTYNRAHLLKSAIQSIVDQTYPCYEVIVVDDGSTDDTRAVVAEFDPAKIRYVFQANKGRSQARNVALKEVRGEYVAFLDSDDMFTPEKLKKQVEALEENPLYGLVYTSARVYDEEGTELFLKGESESREPYYKASEKGWVYDKIAFYLPLTVILPSVMVRRKIMESVGGFDENLHRFEDTDMWRRFAKQTMFFPLYEPYCHVRTHSGNKMEHPDNIYRSIKYYVKKIFRDDKDISLKIKLVGSSRLFLNYAYAILNNKTYNKLHSLKFFLASFMYFPPYIFMSIVEKMIYKINKKYE